MPEYKYPTFLNLPPELSDPETSFALILPLPVDITASWKRGTAAGPQAIIEASHHIELFDEQLGYNPVKKISGIATWPAPELPVEIDSAMTEIKTIADSLVRNNRLLLSLGGEHSVTYPLVAAHKTLWPDICVLQIDAHADLRDEYMGSRQNHACPMRRIMDDGIHVTALGIRSVDEDEGPILDGPLRRTFLDCEYNSRLVDYIPEILESLPSEHVYLTIDLDGFDPAIAPAVGTPSPGGLGWYESLRIIQAVAEHKQIVGADIVELMPTAGLHGTDSLASRLAYKIISYCARS